MKINRQTPSPRTVNNYKQANFAAIKYELSDQTTLDNPGVDPETQWQKMKNRLTKLTKQCIYLKSKIRNRHNLAWIDEEVVHLSHWKRCALNKSKKMSKLEHKTRFR